MVLAFDEASVTGDKDTVSPLNQIIQCSKLGGELKSVYESLKQSGQVLFYLNQWVEINFCLPHKIHAMHTPGRVIQLESIYGQVYNNNYNNNYIYGQVYNNNYNNNYIYEQVYNNNYIYGQVYHYSIHLY